MFILEKAVETAKYANHAKTEPIEEKDGFTQRENALFDSTFFPFAYLACFAVCTAEFRFIVFGPNTLKLRRSAMLREHFAPAGFGRLGLALTIDIALLTEFSCAWRGKPKLMNSEICVFEFLSSGFSWWFIERFAGWIEVVFIIALFAFWFFCALRRHVRFSDSWL